MFHKVKIYKKAIIYGLTDEHGIIRYVGKTVNPKARFNRHKACVSSFAVSGMAILETVENSCDVGGAEKKWVAFFGRDNLLNRTDGGASWANPPSEEHCNNISLGAKKRWESSEKRYRQSIKLKETHSRIAVKEKMIQHARIKAKDSEYRRKLSDATMRRANDPLYRKKLSDGLKKYWADPVNRDRQSRLMKEVCTDSGLVKRRIDGLKRYLSSANGKQVRSEAMKKVSLQSHVIDSRRKRMQDIWKDKDKSNILREKMREGWAKRKSEQS